MTKSLVQRLRVANMDDALELCKGAANRIEALETVLAILISQVDAVRFTMEDKQ